MSHRLPIRGVRLLILLGPWVFVFGGTTAYAEPITPPRLVFNAGQRVPGVVVLSTEDANLSGSAQVVSGGIVSPPDADFSNPEHVQSSTQFSVVLGLFRFTTGSFSHTDADGREFVFGPGGEFEMTGAIPQLGIAESARLLTGTFTSFGYFPVRPVVSFYPFLGDVLTMHPALIALIGELALSSRFVIFGGLQGVWGPDSLERPFVLQTTSAVIFVQPTGVAPVPEPATLLFVGSGIVIGGMGWFRRRRTDCAL